MPIIERLKLASLPYPQRCENARRKTLRYASVSQFRASSRRFSFRIYISNWQKPDRRAKDIREHIRRQTSPQFQGISRRKYCLQQWKGAAKSIDSMTNETSLQWDCSIRLSGRSESRLPLPNINSCHLSGYVRKSSDFIAVQKYNRKNSHLLLISEYLVMPVKIEWPCKNFDFKWDNESNKNVIVEIVLDVH
jgi:hypothetical protein